MLHVALVELQRIAPNAEDAANKSSKHFTASNRWQATGARSRKKRISVDDAKHIVLAVAHQQVGPSNGRERPTLHSRSVRRGLGFNEALLRSVSGGVPRATQMTKSLGDKKQKNRQSRHESAQTQT